MHKIFISDKLADDALKLLEADKDIEFVMETGLSEDTLAEKLDGYDGLIIRSGTTVTAKVLEKTKTLKIIGRAGVGVDNVDIPAASAKGVIVMNTPDANTLSTCEQTIALILASARNTAQAYASLKEKKWERSKFTGSELYGKTLGVIGLGRIGTEVAKRMASFGMKIIGYDPFVTKDRGDALGIEVMELDDVISKADVITLHIPKNKETKDLINKDKMGKMKEGVILINCARGGVVNEKDLYDACKSGKVAKAALDVFEKEPPFDSPLLELDNVVLTPHLGASTVEAQGKVGKGIVEQVVEALKGGMVKNAVNIPAIDPEMLKEMQPFLALNEKLGSFAAQLAGGNIKKTYVEYSGEVTNFDLKILTIAALKGILAPAVGDGVNYVNAELLAKERGIEIVQKTTDVKSDFPNLISVTIETDKEKRKVFGILSVNKEVRIVKIDNFEMEIKPEKHMIVYKNVDKPGIVGRVGTILGEKNVNIASFDVGRSKEEKVAMGVLSVDSDIPEDVIESIKNVADVIEIKSITI
ncbi:MAG: phosphoglycerate dehydrogenase [Candidatus Goldiibacteriota bacterium]